MMARKKKEPRPDVVPFEIPDRIEMNYRYSYGGISPFFRAIKEEAKLLGSRCARCKKTYLPPRINCSQCYRPTKWVPLGNEGTVITCTTVYYATSRFFSKTPFVCAYIRVDGADTLLLQNIILDEVTQARPGIRVRALFRPERKGEMADFYFVPV
ncbi:MAG: Zn-ribbon domain-containing OB-fold protein [Candidatus Manganitrophus sp. SB1]|nr:Zn-ribbon domain-containing OB-fold protein [Candidatus Manganitrophus morganii]